MGSIIAGYLSVSWQLHSCPPTFSFILQTTLSRLQLHWLAAFRLGSAIRRVCFCMFSFLCFPPAYTGAFPNGSSASGDAVSLRPAAGTP